MGTKGEFSVNNIVKYLDLVAPKVLIFGTDLGSSLLAPFKMDPNECKTVWPFSSSSNPALIPEATCFSGFDSTSFQYLM